MFGIEEGNFINKHVKTQKFRNLLDLIVKFAGENNLIPQRYQVIRTVRFNASVFSIILQHSSSNSRFLIHIDKILDYYRHMQSSF